MRFGRHEVKQCTSRWLRSSHWLRYRPCCALLLTSVLFGCEDNSGCEIWGTCSPLADAALSTGDADVVDAGETNGDSSSVTAPDAASFATIVEEVETAATVSSPAPSSVESGVPACDPVSEQGCDSPKPWCIAQGEASLGSSQASTRCVQCERDGDCQQSDASAQSSGICLGNVCVECETATHRGCGGDTPYCVSIGVDGGQLAEPVMPMGERAQVMAPQCVECVSADDCSGSTPACVNHACAECERDEQCTDPAAAHCDSETHTCVGCNEVGQCARFDETPACDVENGVCVECTREEQARCDGTAQGGFDAACVTIQLHPDYQTCSDQRRDHSTQCNECVSDEQCRAGFRCVPEVFTSSLGGTEVPTGKHYCMALQSELEGGKVCGNNRPFVGYYTAVSEGDVAGVYCRPTYTTCAGYADWKTGPDSVSTEDGGTITTCASDDSCGLPDLKDGYCVEFTPTTNRCTYPCDSEDDCPLPHSTCDMTSPPPGFKGSCSVELD